MPGTKKGADAGLRRLTVRCSAAVWRAVVDADGRIVEAERGGEPTLSATTSSATFSCQPSAVRRAPEKGEPDFTLGRLRDFTLAYGEGVEGAIF